MDPASPVVLPRWLRSSLGMLFSKLATIEDLLRERKGAGAVSTTINLMDHLDLPASNQFTWNPEVDSFSPSSVQKVTPPTFRSDIRAAPPIPSGTRTTSTAVFTAPATSGVSIPTAPVGLVGPWHSLPSVGTWLLPRPPQTTVDLCLHHECQLPSLGAGLGPSFVSRLDPVLDDLLDEISIQGVLSSPEPSAFARARETYMTEISGMSEAELAKVRNNIHYKLCMQEGYLDLARLQASVRIGTLSYSTALKIVLVRLGEEKDPQAMEELTVAKEELLEVLREIRRERGQRGRRCLAN